MYLSKLNKLFRFVRAWSLQSEMIIQITNQESKRNNLNTSNTLIFFKKNDWWATQVTVTSGLKGNDRKSLNHRKSVENQFKALFRHTPPIFLWAIFFRGIVPDTGKDDKVSSRYRHPRSPVCWTGWPPSTSRESLPPSLPLHPWKTSSSSAFPSLLPRVSHPPHNNRKCFFSRFSKTNLERDDHHARVFPTIFAGRGIRRDFSVHPTPPSNRQPPGKAD